jgi:hypothetical protein
MTVIKSQTRRAIELKKGDIIMKRVKKMLVIFACVTMVAALAVSASANTTTPAIDPAALDGVGDAIVGVVNMLLPVGIAIMTPIIGLRLIPRIVYMFL